MERRDVNIIDYIVLIYKTRKFIITNIIVVSVLAAVVSLFLPSYYSTKSVILPPQEESRSFGFSDVLSSIQVPSLQLGSKGSPVDLAMGMLKSDTIAYMLVDKYDLVEVFGAKNVDRAKASLQGATDVNLSDDGLVEIAVEMRDPELAASIANDYCAALDSIKIMINQNTAKARADFLVVQIHENEAELEQAEAELKNFQMKTKAISPYMQQQVAISVAAELELDLMKKENQLKELKAKSFSSTHPIVKGLLSSITFNEDMLQTMRFGSKEHTRESLFVPLQETPDLILLYTKLSRRVEILGMLEQLLRQNYEEARIEQVNTNSSIIVVDRARAPMDKSRPKRKLIVMVAAAAALFFSIIVILTIDFIGRLAEVDEENKRRIDAFARILHID